MIEIATGFTQEPAMPPKGYFAMNSVTKIIKNTATTGYMGGKNIPMRTPCNKVTRILIERFRIKIASILSAPKEAKTEERIMNKD